MQLHRVSTASKLSLTCLSLALKLVLLYAAEAQLQHRGPDLHWYPGTATWYGDPEGDGSTGGACGYGTMVDVKPFRARVGALGPLLFMKGEGCGACYKVKCLDKSICSRRAVTVIITDECPGCPSDQTHFDLSGAAFGRMAIAGENGPLRDRGQIPVIYRRTPCKYPGRKIAFHVNEGSTPFWLSLLVEFEDAEGDIGSMHIREAGSTEWLQMNHLWGANWCIIGGPLRGPFSVKLSSSTGRSLSARDVIPTNWVPKATYTSRLNFYP
ncbi:expansin-B3-like [Glycine soja]|uniref:Expansin-B3 n=1 Tax=Glycine soja TaxID=3848 RepID=A0A445HNZ6_GLYSO|nr:expansin-B3-like [Glycine soja]RZB75340.1 Expansin-B3 [Glycine soja]